MLVQHPSHQGHVRSTGLLVWTPSSRGQTLLLLMSHQMWCFWVTVWTLLTVTQSGFFFFFFFLPEVTKILKKTKPRLYKQTPEVQTKVTLNNRNTNSQWNISLQICSWQRFWEQFWKVLTPATNISPAHVSIKGAVCCFKWAEKPNSLCFHHWMNKLTYRKTQFILFYSVYMWRTPPPF